MKGLEATPHKYQKICDHILQQIEDGDLRPGMRLPGVRALGKEYGCNYHTVRHAFEALAEQGYVELKRGSGTFVTNRVVQEKKWSMGAEKVFRQTDSIGILLPLWQRWGHYVTSLIDQLHRSAELQGLNLNIRTVMEINMHSASLVHELLEQDCCSVILPWIGVGQKMNTLHDFVRASELPVVLPYPVHGLEENCYYRSLPSDLDVYYSGTYLQCHYFQLLGYKNIALLGPSKGGAKYFEHKLLQYTRWADRESMPNLIGLADGSVEDFERIADRWSSLKGDLAIIAYHDEMALSFMKACQKKGISFPDDFAILGHNNNPTGLRSDPPLSTMLCPYDHIAEGMLAHALALSRNESEQLGGQEPKAFFIRESCGGRMRKGNKLDALVDSLLKDFYKTDKLDAYFNKDAVEGDLAMKSR
jgi:GntR family transcriptional regulator of arabinose operon